MSIALKTAGQINALITAELLIRRAIDREDASPFLAHCPITETDRARFAASLKHFLQGDAGLLPEAFRRWPLTTVWAFAQSLSESYGEDGNAVYAVLERTFAVDMEGDVRSEVSDAFRSTCRRYGLCYAGTGRFVDDYLAQAGIANTQLHLVAEAFLAAERAFGAPGSESTAALNDWEDHASDFLPCGINVPRMVLEVDQTAYYAFLFTRFRGKEAPRNQVETLFFKELSEAASSLSGGRGGAEAIARPALVWVEGGLALSLPKAEGRLTVSVGEDTRNLRGGQQWLLPTPWPSHVDWQLGAQSGRIHVFPTARHILTFDAGTGRLLASIDPEHTPEAVVDGREVMLVASRPFVAEGEEAFEIASNGYAIHRLLGPDGVRIRTETQVLHLTAKPKARIWVETGVVAKGAGDALLSGQSVLVVDLGGLETGAVDLTLLMGTGGEITVPLTTSADAEHATVRLAEHAGLAGDLMAISAELRLRGSKRTLVRYKAWLWPGLRGLADGLIFDSDTIPGNYSPAYSRHVRTDHAGRLCLDPDAAYQFATLAFTVRHERIVFDIPRPGLVVSFTDAEGRGLPLKLGDTLVVGEEDKACSLRIRCPYPQAKLNVRGRLEPRAFERSSTRILSLADLTAPAPREDVSIEAPQLGPCPVLLARLVPAVTPKHVSIKRRAARLEVKIEMQAGVDALRLSLEDEDGGSEECECALAYRPVARRALDWFSAELDFDNPRRILATIKKEGFTAASLGSLSVRLAGSDAFRPLRSSRGDSYALLVEPADAHGAAGATGDGSKRKRFVTLNAWMCRCFAKECWEQFGTSLKRRWMKLGTELAAAPGGMSLLLSCAHAPREAGATRRWVPIAHPLQIVPDLYALPASRFSCLAADVSEGSDHLATLADTAGWSLPRIHQRFGLSLAFLTAFENYAQAFKSELPPVGFSFETYRQRFVEMDTNPGARWFWQPGDELLGPAHYGAALGRLIDRFLEAGLDEEGWNEERIRAASLLGHAAHRLNEPALPIPGGFEITHDVLECVPFFISGFARSSRRCATGDFVRGIARFLGCEERVVLVDASFLVRLAPELLAFYLLLWELASERRPS